MQEPIDSLGQGAAKDGEAVIRNVPYMGVIWVVHEAMKKGFKNLDPEWCNLGQGQPEVGPMEGAPPRLKSVQIEPADCAYGPVGGIDELRDVVAEHYNSLYRRGKRRKYGRKNVSIAAGGRLALSRLVAVLGAHRLGHFIPDYTAYEDLLDYHKHRITPVAIPTPPESGFHLSAEELHKRIIADGLGSILFSNPCNPTGNVVATDQLLEYLNVARKTGCYFLVDEFYSHFVFDKGEASRPVSAAEYIEDIESDPIVIIDGLTKNFRYPGFRVGWVVGPEHIIESITRGGSAIDGGPPTIIQRAAIQILEPERTAQESSALRVVFSRKRALMLGMLREMGVDFVRPGLGTFYLWGSVRDLPAPLHNADDFFRLALERKVMVVPGRFFDVNPGNSKRPPYIDPSWVRFSFGPPESNIRLGLDRLADLVGSVKRTGRP